MLSSQFDSQSCHKRGHFKPVRESKSKNAYKVINNITATQHTKAVMTSLFQVWYLIGSTVKIPKGSNNIQVGTSAVQSTGINYTPLGSISKCHICNNIKAVRITTHFDLKQCKTKAKQFTPSPDNVTHTEHSEMSKHLTPLSSGEAIKTMHKEKTVKHKNRGSLRNISLSSRVSESKKSHK